MSESVATVEELRTLYRPPGQRALDKQIDHLDGHCRDFIAHSPFFILSTADANGACDASPKGGPPGFVAVLDEHRLAFADLSGNNRLDSLQNLTANPGIAMLFLIPGTDETLRVNGRATLSTDPVVLEATAVEGVAPRLAVVVQVAEAYIHCAKALRRGRVWETAAWPDVSDMATPACILRDHAQLSDMSVEDVKRGLEENYATSLWRPGG